MHITLKQLRAFIAVSEHGAFTQAARELHLTQSALSVLIRELERQLAVRLFDRTTRSVALTEAGAELFPVIQKVLADLSSAVQYSKELSDNARGRVSLAASPLLSSTVIPSLIRGFSDRFPGIHVALRDSDEATVQRKVQRGEADLGIGAFTQSEHDLLGERLTAENHLVACPKAHALASHANIDLPSLRHVPLVLFPRGNSTRDILDQRFAEVGITATPTYEVAFLWTALAMVDAGLGFAVVPGQAATLQKHFTNAVFRSVEGLKIKREVHLLTHKYRSLSPAAEAFRQFAREFFPAMAAPVSAPRTRTKRARRLPRKSEH